MKKLVISVMSLLICVSLNVQGITTTLGFQNPNPVSGTNPVYVQQEIALPAVGVAITEPSFGLNLTRLTTAGSLGSRHEYSRFDPYNKDQSKIILIGNGLSSVYQTQTFPYNAPTNVIHNLAVTEPRWDRNETNKIWGLSGASIKTVDLSSSKPTVKVVNDFSTNTYLTNKLGYKKFSITMKDEGESSYDKRYWALLVRSEDGSGKQHIITWDKSNASNSRGGVIGTYELTAREKDNIDWVGMSPKGDHVLVGGLDYAAEETTQNITGLTMASKNFDRFHRLDYITAHADVGLDSDGNEVIVMQNTRTDYIDLIPIDWHTKAIKDGAVDNPYANTNRTKLVKLHYDSFSTNSFDLASGVHISGNYDGYALISTTSSEAPGVDNEGNWLERTIFLVSLDPESPEAQYISKIYNSTDTYWQETHGTITNDGTKVLWAANWDQAGLQGRDFDNFLLQVDMASVPIPNALLLLGSSLLGLVGLSRRPAKK